MRDGQRRDVWLDPPVCSVFFLSLMPVLMDKRDPWIRLNLFMPIMSNIYGCNNMIMECDSFLCN